MRGRGVSEFQLLQLHSSVFAVLQRGGKLLLSVFLWFWTSRRIFEEILGVE